MNQYFYKTCDPIADRLAVIDVYHEIRDELCLPDQTAVTKMVDLIFERGGVTGGYAGTEQKLVGALGYFLGDPGEQFADPTVLFLYVGAILPDYRGSRLFRGGLCYTLRRMSQVSVTRIRLQAETTNPFTNKLYSRFATPIGQGKSLRGRDVITYEATVGDALNSLSRSRRAYAPTPHHVSPVAIHND